MKVRGPMHSIDARGRMADSFVYSIWRGLNYLRGLTIPTNPQSARQVTIRGYLTDASRAWESLTDAQRLAWRNAAATKQKTNPLGQTYYASGLNMYSGLYIIASDAGQTPVSDVPATVEPVTLAGAAEGTHGAGTIHLVWTATDGDFVDCWMTPKLSAGVAVQKNMYRHFSYTAIGDLEEEITGLVDGGRYVVKLRAIRNNGQAGPYSVFDCIAAL